MSSEEEKQKQMKDQLEAGNKFKVLTQAEYEALLLLSNPTGGTVSSTGATAVSTATITSTVANLTSTPDGGAKPKFTFASPGFTPLQRLRFNLSNQSMNASYVPQYSQPKLPVFSGHESKTDVSYEVWSFEVKCLRNSQTVPEHIILQAIRTSLRGSARNMITTLGENATVTDILEKLHDYYGTVSSCETLMQNFYSDSQKDDESIVDYGSRIEQTLTRAFRTTQMEPSLKDAMLRTKFWTGLSNQSLKNSTRHLFDTVKDFQHLLREMRKVEQEQFSATVTPATGKHKVAQQHAGQASNPDITQLSKQLSEMMEKMKAMEKKIDSQQEAVKQFSSQGNDFQNYGSYRGRGYNQGYNRGYSHNRGNGRGSNRGYGKGRGYGRGYQNQNSDNNEEQNTSGRGGFRGKNRGGANGRGNHRGGNSGGQSLN